MDPHMDQFFIKKADLNFLSFYMAAPMYSNANMLRAIIFYMLLYLVKIIAQPVYKYYCY